MRRKLHQPRIVLRPNPWSPDAPLKPSGRILEAKLQCLPPPLLQQAKGPEVATFMHRHRHLQASNQVPAIRKPYPHCESFNLTRLCQSHVVLSVNILRYLRIRASAPPLAIGHGLITGAARTTSQLRRVAIEAAIEGMEALGRPRSPNANRKQVRITLPRWAPENKASELREWERRPMSCFVPLSTAVRAQDCSIVCSQLTQFSCRILAARLRGCRRIEAPPPSHLGAAVSV